MGATQQLSLLDLPAPAAGRRPARSSARSVPRPVADTGSGAGAVRADDEWRLDERTRAVGLAGIAAARAALAAASARNDRSAA